VPRDKVLVVDDEIEMRRLIKIYISEHYEVIEAENGQQALEQLHAHDVSLVLLDVMMPEMNGWEVCKKLRETDALTPILMLTARSDVQDRVRGLTIGADDYLAKPFDPSELLARVNALLRRSVTNQQTDQDEYLIYSTLKIGIESRQVLVSDNEVSLTPKEFELLFTLANNPKRVYTREVLLDQIWSLDDILDVRTVDTHIKNIREKLKKAGLPFNPIKTVWGVGYKFMSNEGKNEME
jgi:two-component system response regulator ResD